MTTFCLGAWLLETEGSILGLALISIVMGIYLHVGGTYIDPDLFLWLLLSYLIVGVVWSLCRWYLYIHMFKENLKSLDEAYGKFYPEVSKNHSNYLNNYRNWFQSHVSDSDIFYKSYRFNLMYRKVVKTDSSILIWVIFWPLSLTGVLLRYPVQSIVKIVIKVYQRISKHVLKDVELL